MTNEELVKRYLDAWNDQDLDGLFELMHSGVAYYDAFWTETHVGRGIREAFLDAFDEEPFRYELLGEVVPFDGGIVFRFSARHRLERDGEVLFDGAEVLGIRDEKIVTITTHWVSPFRVDLKEVGEIACLRHGVPIHTY